MGARGAGIVDDAAGRAREADIAAQAAFFAPHRQESLPDQIYEQILIQLGTGRLSVGERLPSETQLSRAFGVSRPVVRTALARLRADGLIESRQGAGSFVVRTLSADFMGEAPSGAIAELLRCYEMRVALEGEAAFLAAERRTARDLAAIEAEAARLAREFDGPDSGAAADVAFHRAIAAATQNHLFSQVMELLRRPLRDGIATARRLAQRSAAMRLPIVLDEHAAVVDAIRAQEPGRARDAMRAHIGRSRDRMLGFEARRGETPPRDIPRETS
ncbi:FadR/GntR family transcriptional regulator [Salinarimonas sp.]|uniref:FadR/GntR family transcriptional regulator n=1 Tax=Salinarimonas sp. TaxID=2766526 RepID=UPI0032D8D08F